MQTAPHIVPSLLAFVLLLGGVWIFEIEAHELEAQYVHAIAPLLVPIKNQGSALQEEALRTSDLLPIYGSSELLRPVPYLLDYNASGFFAGYPTGFTIFPVGKQETAPLLHAEKLAVLGSELRGRKIVISLSPSWFFERDVMVAPDAYAANYSSLHGYMALTNRDLSYSLRSAIASRMLDYPDTLRHDALLSFVAHRLVDHSASGRLAYLVALPFAQLEGEIHRLQDDWETVSFIASVPELPTLVPHKPDTIDWKLTAATAAAMYSDHSSSNEYAVDDERWKLRYEAETQARRQSAPLDNNFREGLQEATDWWIDLDLLLRELTELGAKPLIVCAPIHGTYYDSLGVTKASRDLYYERMRAAVAKYGFPLIDFASHDEQLGFLLDTQSHPSPLGWVYFDQVLDAFYHDQALDPDKAMGYPSASQEWSRHTTPAVEAPIDSDPGSLDPAEDHQLVGWAWDSNFPNKVVAVKLMADGKNLATVRADEPRPDLVKAGKGNGLHGFSTPIPDRLYDGNLHTFTAENVALQTPLNDSPGIVRLPLAVRQPRMEAAATAPVATTSAVEAAPTSSPAVNTDPGSLDGVDATDINGWAWDPSQPNGTVNVQIFDGKTLVATLPANQLRPDLVTAGKGNGQHGFNIKTPAALFDGKPHTIHAQIVGGPELSTSPLVVTLHAPAGQ